MALKLQLASDTQQRSIREAHTHEYFLSPEEVGAVLALSEELASEQCGLESFLDQAPLHAARLPLSLRAAFRALKFQQSYRVLVIRGLDLDPETVPATPSHYSNANGKPLKVFDVPHLLFASLLGEVFTFASIQMGSLISDILPLEENGNKSISSNYLREFPLHTDDSFSEFAGEFLGLRSLRNPDLIPTQFSAPNIEHIGLSEYDALFEREFRIPANLAHRTLSPLKNRLPILFGSRWDPYLRINMTFDAAADAPARCREAYRELCMQLCDDQFSITLAPGDLMYIDNTRIAHGRVPYVPRFDGTDRWLRRVYIAESLRRTRHLRLEATSRIISQLAD